jgi:hypothetical protein
MTLDQPLNERCNNCYFCTSYMKNEEVYKGWLIGSVTTTIEKFLCKRYPPSNNLICMTTNSIGIKYRIESSESVSITVINPKSWCGEWKPRKETNIKI